MRNLTLIFDSLEEEHLGKDVFLVPYYLGKQNGYTVTIVYPQSVTNKHFLREYRGVKLVSLKFREKHRLFIFREWNFFRYLYKNAHQIDCLMRFHNNNQTVLAVLLYKMLNPKGIVYVKGDVDACYVQPIKTTKGFVKRILKKCIYSWYTDKLDYFSCETQQAYNKIKKQSSGIWHVKDKLLLLPNGFDEEYLKKLDICDNFFEQKENLIITVGRLGTYPKNTEMFLSALEYVNLKNWKVILIGPVENSFREKIVDFYRKYPLKKDTVRFIGPVTDKKELWEYYNKAKVFVFTSRYESYGLVLNEARRFRNYILSTDVGAFRDLTNDGKLGMSIPFDDSATLACAIQDIIDGKKNIDVYKEIDVSANSWDNIIRHLKLN